MDALQISLMGFVLFVVFSIAAVLYRIRVDATAGSDAAMKKADEAMAKAHAVELAVAKEYVALPALHQATSDLLREMQNGFNHLNEKVEALAKQGRKIGRGEGSE